MVSTLPSVPGNTPRDRTLSEWTMTDLTNRDARRLTEEALRLQGQAAERQL